MKNLKLSILFLLGLVLFTATINSCNKTTKSISEEDTKALLFMLEEEKLARDTYIFLADKWDIQQFANIKDSEQKHMDAIASVLDEYKIQYTILEIGKFDETKLQGLYDQFLIDGIISSEHALQIGATIEDLDIMDLVNYENAATNQDVKDVFSTLRCGSRNHIRKFTESIVNDGDNYTPQFISLADYTSITNSSNEKCGK